MKSETIELTVEMREEINIPICGTWEHRTSRGNVCSHGVQGWWHASRSHRHPSVSRASQSKSAMCTCATNGEKQKP